MSRPDHIAVIGGGINGVCIAWELARAGARVTLYERGELMGATSSASSKLLHGGLRYLEHGALRLVREGVLERGRWIADAPGFAGPLDLVLPLYADARRPRWQVKLGLWTYDRLAGRGGLGDHRWLAPDAVLALAPRPRAAGLLGAYRFRDGRMDDRALGLWAAREAARAGAELVSGRAVTRVRSGGEVEFAGGATARFDHVVNAAGPWAEQLLAASGEPTRHRASLVRGSHLVVPGAIAHGWVLEHPADGRVVFALPWQGATLLGTTEVVQAIDEPVACSDAERDYLLAAWNARFDAPLRPDDVIDAFAGVRPLLDTGRPAGRTSRESVIETRGRLTTVWGGKWTTARALARRVAKRVRG